MQNETIGFWNKSCIIQTRLDEKLAIVTGANSGIGLATVGELTRRGATVIMACRNMEKADKAKQELLDRFGADNPQCLTTDIACEEMKSVLTPIQSDQLIISQLDMASLEDVRQFAQRITQQYSKLDYLINNAAVANPEYEETVDGYELTMAVNHLAPFLLTQLLLPLLKNSDKPGRVIMVSSFGHVIRELQRPNLFDTKLTFKSMPTYSRTKLANIMYAIELSKRADGEGVIAVSLNPGFVKTNFAHGVPYYASTRVAEFLGFIMRTPWQGAQTTMYTVLNENLISGAYYDNCGLKTPSKSALDVEACAWLWQKCCELVGLNELEK